MQRPTAVRLPEPLPRVAGWLCATLLPPVARLLAANGRSLPPAVPSLLLEHFVTPYLEARRGSGPSPAGRGAS